MKEPSIQQLFLIDSLLSSFGRRIGCTRISKLVDNDSYKASTAITRLKALSAKEAQRISKLPLDRQPFEHKQITEDQFRWVFK